MRYEKNNLWADISFITFFKVPNLNTNNKYILNQPINISYSMLSSMLEDYCSPVNIFLSTSHLSHLPRIVALVVFVIIFFF